jgi:hypothetical protein
MSTPEMPLTCFSLDSLGYMGLFSGNQKLLHYFDNSRILLYIQSIDVDFFTYNDMCRDIYFSFYSFFIGIFIY